MTAMEAGRFSCCEIVRRESRDPQAIGASRGLARWAVSPALHVAMGVTTGVTTGVAMSCG